MTRSPSSLRMTRIMAACCGALIASLAASAPALAQQTETISVTAPHEARQQFGRTYTGIPITEVTVVRRVSYSGLDLTKQPDMAQLEQRIKGTARSACHELDALYPALLSPASMSPAHCVRAAVDDAMAQAKMIRASLVQ